MRDREKFLRVSVSPRLPIRLQLVDLARFERAPSTFAQSRSDSAELQVRKHFRFLIGGFRFVTSSRWKAITNQQSTIENALAEAAGVEPAHAMRGDLANR